MEATRTALHLEILTTDLGFFAPDTMGLADAIQAVRIRVSSQESTAVHLVVRACQPPFVLRARVEEVCVVFPGEVVSVVVREDAGSATIACAEQGELVAFAAAAATATLMRAWGWNESPTILIEVGAHRSGFRVNPVFAASGWIVARVEV